MRQSVCDTWVNWSGVVNDPRVSATVEIDFFFEFLFRVFLCYKSSKKVSKLCFESVIFFSSQTNSILNIVRWPTIFDVARFGKSSSMRRKKFLPRTKRLKRAKGVKVEEFLGMNPNIPTLRIRLAGQWEFFTACLTRLRWTLAFSWSANSKLIIPMTSVLRSVALRKFHCTWSDRIYWKSTTTRSLCAVTWKSALPRFWASTFTKKEDMNEWNFRKDWDVQTARETLIKKQMKVARVVSDQFAMITVWCSVKRVRACNQ